MTAFAPTHTASPNGMPTWDEPDASLAAGPSLEPGLPVRVLERWGDWARIECSNGWMAWVDGRHLTAVASAAATLTSPPRAAGPPPASAAAAPAPAARAVAAPVAARPAGAALDRSPLHIGALQLSVPLVAAVAGAIGAFLPWLSVAGASATAMKIPVSFLLDYKTTETGGLKAGYLVILLAVAAVALCVRPDLAPQQLRRAAGGGLALVATIYFAQMQRLVGQTEAGTVFSAIGFGVYVTLAAGVLVAIGKTSADE